jgi:hypothetical protein
MKFACFLSRQQTLCRAIAVASRIVHGAFHSPPTRSASAIGCTQARFVMGAKRCSSNPAPFDQRKSVSNCSSAIFRDLSFVSIADLANWHDRPHMR